MKADILKRLEKLEHSIKSNKSPDMVIITYEPSIERWRVKETYCKYSLKGSIIPKLGEDVEFLIDDPDQYKVSNDFHGVIIIDDLYALQDKTGCTRAIVKNY